MKSGFGGKVLGEKIVATVFAGDSDESEDGIVRIERTDKEEVLIQISVLGKEPDSVYVQLDEFLRAAKRVKEAEL